MLLTDSKECLVVGSPSADCATTVPPLQLREGLRRRKAKRPTGLERDARQGWAGEKSCGNRKNSHNKTTNEKKGGSQGDKKQRNFERRGGKSIPLRLENSSDPLKFFGREIRKTGIKGGLWENFPYSLGLDTKGREV